MTRQAQDIQGLAARRAALRLLDAVLRRGETLDQAAGAATAGLLTSSDGALARAIASEVLRWLVDLDALIDSATRTNLADDAKARTVLRIMLAQWLRLETPPHAVVATGLPLLAGGPRRGAWAPRAARYRGARARRTRHAPAFAVRQRAAADRSPRPRAAGSRAAATAPA